jgi:hypothetical protein
MPAGTSDLLLPSMSMSKKKLHASHLLLESGITHRWIHFHVTTRGEPARFADGAVNGTASCVGQHVLAECCVADGHVPCALPSSLSHPHPHPNPSLLRLRIRSSMDIDGTLMDCLR